MCENSEVKNLKMYFTVNLALVNYFDDAIEDLGISILKNWTTQEQSIPISVETFEISPHLLNAPKTLNVPVNQYKNKQKILEIKKTKGNRKSKDKLQIWLFSQKFSSRCTSFHSCIVTMIVTLAVIYMVCGQSKLKALVANIALQCAKRIEAADMTDRYCICKTSWYIIGRLLIMMLGIIYLCSEGFLFKQNKFFSRETSFCSLL